MVALIVGVNQKEQPRRRPHLERDLPPPDPVNFPQKSGPRERTEQTAPGNRIPILTDDPDQRLTNSQKAEIDRQIEQIPRWNGGKTDSDELFGILDAQLPHIVAIIQAQHRLEPEQLEFLEMALKSMRNERILAFNKSLSEPFQHKGKTYRIVNPVSARELISPTSWLLDIPETWADEFPVPLLFSTYSHLRNHKPPFRTESQYRYSRLLSNIPLK